MTEPLSKLSAALVAASAEMPAVAFDETNPFLKNRFASLGAVIAAARPILAKHGLAIMQFACSDEQGRVGVRTRLIHSSGEWLEESIYLPLHEEKGKSQAQVAGSIITYLRRYAQSSLLNLYADADTDGNALAGDSSVPDKRPSSAPHAAPKPPAPTSGAQGGAKGSAPPKPTQEELNAAVANVRNPETAAKACKARFLQVIAEKQWMLYAWSYAVSQGWMLDTERLEDAPPEKFPKTAQDMAKIEAIIKRAIDDAAAHGGITQEEQEAYDAAYFDPATMRSEPEPEHVTEHEWWMDLVMPFGNQKGMSLIEMDRKDLFYWAKNYQPKPFRGAISDKDKELRKALDEALSWMTQHPK